MTTEGAGKLRGRITNAVQNWIAPLLGFDERTAWRYLGNLRVLGVGLRDEGYLPEWGDGDPGKQGPVPDVPTTYVLPKGTLGVSVTALPGEVSGAIYVGGLANKNGKTTVDIWATSGCSGVIGRQEVDPPWVNPPALKDRGLYFLSY
jgi:hypothetical protein